jgi:hypothetical protein
MTRIPLVVAVTLAFAGTKVAVAGDLVSGEVAGKPRSIIATDTARNAFHPTLLPSSGTISSSATAACASGETLVALGYTPMCAQTASLRPADWK